MIGPNVYIGPGAVVKDSVIMRNTVIGSNTVVDKSILAENVIVGNDVVLGSGKEAENMSKPKVYAFGLVTIGEHSVIPDGVKIGKNTAISGVTTAKDYVNGELPSGGVIAKDGESA